MNAPKQTARFASMVKECGRPEPVTLWAGPGKDREFQSAIDEKRVLTIHQETVGSRKDFGLVGFRREARAFYLVFPKPLTKYEGKRIVGIDYSLLKPPPAAKEPAERPPREREIRAAKPSRPKPRPKPRFRVIVRCVSTMDIPVDVEAGNKADAKQQAVAAMARKALDFSRGTQSRVAVKTMRIRETDRGSAALFRRVRGLPDLPDSGRDGG